MWVSDSKLTVTKLTPELLSPGQGTPDQIVDADLGPEYTELIPVADMKGLTSAKKKMAAMAAGPDSALRMLSADDPTEELPESITPDNVDDLYQPGLPFFDAEEVANSISTDNIQAVLEKLREEEDGDEDQSGMGGMSPKMCTMLKKVLSNASKLIFNDDDDDASILGEKSGTELGSLPPCIIGRLSAPVVSDKALPDQKVAIVSGLSNVKPTQLKMLSKRNCHGLVREAIAASKPTGDLMVEQAEMIGMAASCMDSADIRRLDMLAFDSLKMYFKVSTYEYYEKDIARIRF
ncbi:hypothetical protein FJT64_013557 [Amphibalanus amphitrite]|uniref:Uncharacterized protein n=1 Tax=Amphibalanus amphitrite TaxID=1232801 RepID=A0A6A4VEN1_AMPAM|nr:hypothetical protein FJT64_013557 [Amphibalanus amphitrite]